MAQADGKSKALLSVLPVPARQLGNRPTHKAALQLPTPAT